MAAEGHPAQRPQEAGGGEGSGGAAPHNVVIVSSPIRARPPRSSAPTRSLAVGLGTRRWQAAAALPRAAPAGTPDLAVIGKAAELPGVGGIPGWRCFVGVIAVVPIQQPRARVAGATSPQVDRWRVICLVSFFFFVGPQASWRDGHQKGYASASGPCRGIPPHLHPPKVAGTAAMSLFLHRSPRPLVDRPRPDQVESAQNWQGTPKQRPLPTNHGPHGTLLPKCAPARRALHGYACWKWGGTCFGLEQRRLCPGRRVGGNCPRRGNSG